MADNLIFPIGFDLHKAVEEASNEWNSRYADRLERLLSKRAVKVRLGFDTRKLDDLDAVRKRLAELKIEPLTPANKTAIQELVRDLKELARIMEKIQRFKGIELPELQMAKAAKLRKEVEQANEKLRLSQERVRQAEERLLLSQKRAEMQARRTGAAYGEQSTYLRRLAQRMAAYWSIRQTGQFLTAVREVTAQFELQRVSLGAIIQDQNRANQLFSEIKSFALKSPVSILDLTKYTKQLAAYKIGYDELFETTKKLTDVSVGLGVAMDRVVLAYGQTRATGYLRASEIRQFTEMGVPIVEELAAKLSKMNGELVTAAQVMDMVSKRGVSFELVKEVFDDMTAAGGMFYNMQEKQGNTLFGLWAKLGDAASVMYDEIGNTESVNKGMKNTIQLLTELMRNWREVRDVSGVAIAGLGAIMAIRKVKGWQAGIETSQIAARQKTTAAEQAYGRAVAATTAARKAGNIAEIDAMRIREAQALYALKAARAEMVAANATTIWSKGMAKLKALVVGNWITALLVGVAALAAHFYNANEKANRLKNTLKGIDDESSVEQMKSVRNFESLANIAVSAADGSKKQKEALDELQRTYKDIIPQERLTIENLREMKGNYDSLTISIKNYVAEQMKQKQVNAIIEETGREMLDNSRAFQEAMKDTWNYEQVTRFMTAYERIIRDNPAIDFSEAMEKTAEETGVAWDKVLSMGTFDKSEVYRALNKYGLALKEQIRQIEAVESAWNNNYVALGKYGSKYEELVNAIKENPVEAGGSPDISEDRTPYLFKQQQQNLEILKAMIPTLQKIMSDAGVVWQEGWANIVSVIDASQPQIISSINFEAINKYLNENLSQVTDEQRKAIAKLQNMYGEIGIPNEVVRYNRKIAIDIANDMSEALSKLGNGTRTALDNVSQYFMASGQSVNEYAKTLDDAIKSLKARIAELSAIGALLNPNSRKELDDLKKLEEYIERVRASISAGVTAGDGTNRGRASDPRLGILQEMVSTLKQVNKEYEDLVKKEGETRALADTQKVYVDTFKNMQQLAKKHKFALPDFDVPTDVASLTKYLNSIREAMKKLPKSDKAALSLQVDIDKLNIDEQQKKIETELKRLSDRISRLKTAKDFYGKILGATGDSALASKVARSIFGQNGSELQKALAEQLRGMTNKIELPEGIISAESVIDYKALREFAEANRTELGKTYEELVKISEQGQKDLAKTYEGYLKDLEKAKSYSDKRIELARDTANKIAEINASTLPQSEKDRLTAGYREREDKEAAGLEWEAFKNMPMYVQMFDDLDNASATTLTNMKRRLMEMQGQWKNLAPTQLKELQSRLGEVEEQLARRNPFKTLADSVREYRELSARHGGEGGLNKEISAATEAYIKAKDDLRKQLAVNPDDAKTVGDLKKNVDAREVELKRLQKIADAYAKVKKAIGLSLGEVFKATDALGDLAGGIGRLTEVFGGDREDVEYWNDIAAGLNEVTGGIENMVQAALSLDPMAVVTSAVTAIPSMISGFAGLFSAGKVRKANKEIRRQQELLEQLGYTYSRLEAGADKVFGREYLNNYNQQLKNLQAQQTAYLKQAEAERSKGKKKDKDKIREYEEQARETADRIKELQDDLVAHFTGSSRTDVARQMAKSWVDARASMSDTFAAIRGDYQELIKNMIVEGAAARVIENALSPVWDSMEKMLAKNDVEGAIDSLVGGMDAALGAANNGMEVLWKALEARGYDMKQLVGDADSSYTGIAKSVAGATSEEINAVAAIGNTVMYHTSFLPQIYSELVAMRSAGMPTASTGATAEGWTDWQQQAMENYDAIARNTADTVAQCKRAAAACERAAGALDRAMRTKGATSGFNVFLNS